MDDKNRYDGCGVYIHNKQCRKCSFESILVLHKIPGKTEIYALHVYVMKEILLTFHVRKNAEKESTMRLDISARISASVGLQFIEFL